MKTIFSDQENTSFKNLDVILKRKRHINKRFLVYGNIDFMKIEMQYLKKN